MRFASFTTCVALTALMVAACDGGLEQPSQLAADDTQFNPGTELDYGDDTSEWANDGECDDVRFQGSAMAVFLNTDNIGKDASDCRDAVAAGTAEINPLFEEPASAADIVYGDDTAQYANDGECDDIRFTGDYAEDLVFLPDDIGHDATDCREAMESGEARWQGATATPEYGVTSAELEAMSN